MIWFYSIKYNYRGDQGWMIVSTAHAGLLYNVPIVELYSLNVVVTGKSVVNVS